MSTALPSDRIDEPYISTGHLPASDRVRALVHEAYERYRMNDAGAVSQVYPALAKAPRDLFGICLIVSPV